MAARPEARLTVDLLLELGTWSDLSLFKNPVGEGFYRRILPMLEQLAAQGPDALARGWRSVLYRNAVTYGLGVGSPDLVGHYRGRFLGLELKSLRGRAGDDQRKWRKAERRKGAIVEVVRSVEQAKQLLEGMP
jgi:hypothetical protein